MPIPFTQATGDSSVRVTDTTVLYPTDGFGGSSATRGNSEIGDEPVVIRRVVVEGTSTGTGEKTLFVYQNDGTTLYFALPLRAGSPAENSHFLNLVLPNGCSFATDAAATTVEVTYRKLRLSNSVLPSKWMKLEGDTTAVYPTDGAGGTTGTAASSSLRSDADVVIDRVIPLREDDGLLGESDTYCELAGPFTTFRVNVFFAGGSPSSHELGIKSPGRFSALLGDGSTNCIVAYRDLSVLKVGV